jgi:hypothetical protein
MTFADICSADTLVYGIEVVTSTPTPTTTTPWMVALVIAVPLLVGAGWWLLQQRKVVQP